MRSILTVIIFSLLCGEIFAETKRISVTSLDRSVNRGVKYYRKGNYKRAYEELLRPAQLGRKNAQYFLGFLYLKGQHVPQSITTGLASPGVANEIEGGEWRKTYDLVYGQLNAEERMLVDDEVELYISFYGVDEQKINCTLRARPGSRKRKIVCDPRLNVKKPIYDIEGRIETKF